MLSKGEGFFKGYEGSLLHYKLWPAKKAKKALIITHGQAEHSDCYVRLVKALKDLPISIFAWDLRGHGKSEGQRGFVRNFKHYSADLKYFINFLRDSTDFSTEDMFLLGHSMGGLVQLDLISSQSHWPFGLQVLSSPLLGFSVEVPIYKDILALTCRSILPTLTLNNEIKFTDLTRDSSVIDEMNLDTLRHDRISPEAYLGAIETIERLRRDISNVHLPTLVQMAKEDPIVDSNAIKRFFEQLPSNEKQLCIYLESKHEVYNDLERENVYKDLVGFLQKYI